MKGLRWGIMGTGGIAAAMAGTLRDAGSPMTAVGSASADAARAFADRWDIPRATAPHEAMIAAKSTHPTRVLRAHVMRSSYS